MSTRLEQLLKRLQNAISMALDGSSAVSSALEELEDEGLAVYVVIDDPESEADPEAWRVLPGGDREVDDTVDFRIDQTDLGILRKLGIDPTRTLRRGRRARRK